MFCGVVILLALPTYVTYLKLTEAGRVDYGAHESAQTGHIIIQTIKKGQGLVLWFVMGCVHEFKNSYMHGSYRIDGINLWY